MNQYVDVNRWARTVSVREALQVILCPRYLRRTVLIAAVVGAWLTFFNQGDDVTTGVITLILFGKICLNYLTPFVVVNLGLLSGGDSRQPRM